MPDFSLSHTPLDPAALRARCLGPRSGGFVSFEGWVRNHHQGRDVASLTYSAYEELALREGRRVTDEARERFPVEELACVHRLGALQIGDLAVAVAVSAAHREAAFAACRYVIDELKGRVPIWKRELYVDGSHAWPGCHGCQQAAHPHES